MKKKLIIYILLALISITMIVTVVLPAGMAEEISIAPSEYYVIMDLELRDNLLLANYGLTVYMDEVKLGVLPQGGRLITTVSVPAGIHTLSFYPDKKKASVLFLDLPINDNVQIESSLQTHRKYIKINSLSFKFSDGNSNTFRDLSGDAWKKQLTETVTQIAINEIRNASWH